LELKAAVSLSSDNNIVILHWKFFFRFFFLDGISSWFLVFDGVVNLGALQIFGEFQCQARNFLKEMIVAANSSDLEISGGLPIFFLHFFQEALGGNNRWGPFGGWF
jgi:hypothetical protein